VTAVYVTAVPVTTVDVVAVFFSWHLGECVAGGLISRRGRLDHNTVIWTKTRLFGHGTVVGPGCWTTAQLLDYYTVYRSGLLCVGSSCLGLEKVEAAICSVLADRLTCKAKAVSEG
jgi:hypothetical protein